MGKMKKLAAVLFAGIISAGVIIPGAGCSSTEKNINDGKTVNVKLYSAGYGTDYIYALKEQFEKTFKEQGYKLNIYTPRAGFSGELFLQDIAANTGADVYFGGDITEELLNQSAYANTVEDITESVANQKPIGFDGKEEGELTVAQKFETNNNYGLKDYKKSDGTYYAIPFNKGIRGLAVNTAVLKDYNLEIPKTSKEFFNCYDVIMTKAAETGVFPITHIATSNNYPVSFTSSWLAQYGGKEWYDKFFSFQNADGSNLTKTEALDTFNDEPVTYMLENMYHALDPNCGTYGSATQGLEKAQAKFMNGSCAFMMNGDWLLQETYSNFSDTQRNNVTIVSVPVISELGIRLFKNKYFTSEEDCERLLRAIIDEVDENEEISAIKAVVDAEFSVSVDESDIEKVADARGFAYPETISSSVIISARSQVKDIAALFLRFCASEEGGRIIADKTLSTSPFCTSYESNRYEWVNSSRRIINNRYFWAKRPAATGYRRSLGASFVDFFPLTGTFVNIRIISDGVTIYNSELNKVKTNETYNAAAKALQKSIYEDARDNYKSVW